MLPAILCAAGAVAPPALLTRVSDGAGDLLRRTVPLSRPDPRIVIVDIDERSLAALGQWPWRRDRIGQLVERLRASGARVVALDLVLSEPDREQAPAGGGDGALANVLQGGRTVLGYAFTFDRATRAAEPASGSADPTACAAQPLPVAVVEPSGSNGGWPMFNATGTVCSLPDLIAASDRSGFLNATPDTDGILRRVPLVIQMRGRVYPSLGLAASLTLLDDRAAEVRAINANAASLTLGNRAVPLDGRSNLLLRFRGGQRTFPFISAADVLSGRIADGAFRDKLVFVGATALGAQELVATPHDPRFIGVEVQATVADNLLQGDFVRRPAEAPLMEGGVALGAAALVALAVVRYGAAAGGLTAVACVAVFWTAAWWLLARWGVLLSPVLPTASVTFAGIGMAMADMARSARDASADLVRARADVDAAASAHSEFLRTVLRELRTPLSAIQGYARMISRGALADDRKAQALAAVERHAAAQTRVIDDLFEASRAATGRIRLTRQDVDLAEVLRAAADALAPAREARRIVLLIDADPDLGPVAGDAERLQQVAWHLLSNAVKFTPVGGRIDVSLSRDGNQAQLVVRDTGTGITTALLPHVFTARTAAADAGGGAHGLGLGLPLVRQLVELHGGTVAVESSGAGRGATFIVRLPLASEAAPLAVAADALPQLEGVRVVIEDERAGERGRLASALLQAGASVVTAASSQEALALMRDDSRDVLVVTIGGTQPNGDWLAREALAVALNRGERLAIVALGGTELGDDRAQLANVPIDRYLSAPVDVSQLVVVVADVARNGGHHAH